LAFCFAIVTPHNPDKPVLELRAGNPQAVANPTRIFAYQELLRLYALPVFSVLDVIYRLFDYPGRNTEPGVVYVSYPCPLGHGLGFFLALDLGPVLAFGLTRSGRGLLGVSRSHSSAFSLLILPSAT
jgi:hypothetical protein